MSKKHFIALADEIRLHNAVSAEQFTPSHLQSLASFCAASNPNFKRDRWLAYIAGECGQNGGRK